MNVKQGDLVRVEGKEAVVETSWAQGKHRVFKLNDGRQVFDLDKLIADGRAVSLGIAPKTFKPEPELPHTSSIPKSGLVIPMPPVKEPRSEV